MAEPAIKTPIPKIEFPVVIFEKQNEDGTPFKPKKHKEGAPIQHEKSPVIVTREQKILLDVGYISTFGIREYVPKESWKTEKWTVLFDRLNNGDNIMIALPIGEVREKLIAHGIIKVIS